MRILFDQGVPAPLRGHLSGHEVDTTFERGWPGLDNGALLDRAELDGYQLLVTTDQLALWRTGGRQVCFLTHALPDCLPSRLLYRLGNPGVEAFALGLGGCGGSPVDLWRDPEGDLP